MTIHTAQVNQAFQDFLDHYQIPDEYRPGWMDHYQLHDFSHREWSYDLKGKRNYQVAFHDGKTPTKAIYRLRVGNQERFDAVDQKSVVFVEKTTSYSCSKLTYEVYSLEKLQADRCTRN